MQARSQVSHLHYERGGMVVLEDALATLLAGRAVARYSSARGGGAQHLSTPVLSTPRFI